MRKLLEYANLMLKNITFRYVGDGSSHISRPIEGGTIPPTENCGGNTLKQILGRNKVKSNTIEFLKESNIYSRA